jgi:SAM-dependent methyltransferase
LSTASPSSSLPKGGSQTFVFYQTDGLSLRQERNNSVDFVFSFDSLVHAESNVLTAYMQECARILRPGGLAFLHHSNLAASDLPKDGYYHFRGSSTSAETVASGCNEIGLLVLVQEIVSWAGVDALDCFSLIAKPPVPSFHGTVRIDNPGFWGDIGRLRSNIGPYLLGWV